MPSIRTTADRDSPWVCVSVAIKSAHKVSALRVFWYATGRIRVGKFKMIIAEPANTKTISY